MLNGTFDSSKYKWRKVSIDGGPHKINHDYTTVSYTHLTLPTKRIV